MPELELILDAIDGMHAAHWDPNRFLGVAHCMAVCRLVYFFEITAEFISCQLNFRVSALPLNHMRYDVWAFGNPVAQGWNLQNKLERSWRNEPRA